MPEQPIPAQAGTTGEAMPGTGVTPTPRTPQADPLERGGADGGAMTGTTGALVGEGSDEPFVPGELREIGDPAHRRDATVTQERMGAARHPGPGHPEDQPVSGPTELATLDGGYGSEHGLRRDDPAYRVERPEVDLERPERPSSGDRSSRREVDDRTETPERF